MKRIYSAANLMEAHIILDLLRHAGINARLFNENAQGAEEKFRLQMLIRIFG